MQAQIQRTNNTFIITIPEGIANQIALTEGMDVEVQIILSPVEYNPKVRLAIVCSITSKIKGYPFEVALPSDLEVSGIILSDQIKSLDWQTRNAELICKAPPTLTAEVVAKLCRSRSAA